MRDLIRSGIFGLGSTTREKPAKTRLRSPLRLYSSYDFVTKRFRGTTVHLLIPAAGMGRRMGSNRNKLLLSLLDRPLIAWTLEAADASREICWIGLIGQPEDWPDFETILAANPPRKPVQFIQGGSTRQESVYNGLQGLPPEATHVLIHDGARCLATP
ncbi:MAG TPA: 2-C-methyl-D-erythritol 4-phosphate cytidylyltransferase, partial [Vampirovibrionales bacterium]